MVENEGKSTKGQFKEIFGTFPELLGNLINSPSYMRLELPSTLNQGIYVFYENGIPMYVGRTGRKGRFKTRILEHSRPSSGHNTATFAFLLAKEKAAKRKMNVERSRDILEKDSPFKELYLETKKQVSNMKIKLIEIDNPIAQTLFEVYAALELETPYNEWGTH